jgi:LuxR family maltose regulon positive regulatory protein
MQKVGNFVFVVASAFALADILVVLGRLREATHTHRQALQLASEHGQDAQRITAHHHLGLALLHHERGEDAEAAEHLQKAREIGEQTTLVDWSYRWHLAQARLKESEGDLEAALVLLDEARRMYVKTTIPDARPVEALKANLYLKQGRLDRAQDWARMRGLSADDEINYLNEFEHLLLARVRLAEGSFGGLGNLLERLLRLAEAQKRTGSVLEILILQALIFRAQGNQPQALAALERALTLAEPEGYLRTFVDEGETLRSLISDYRMTITDRTHPLLGYLDKILTAFSRPADVIPPSTITGRDAEIIEPLTDRELEILRLIAEGHSNAVIGQRLYLALSTVKGHNLRIFDKLQVQNRTEAVVRARELGLL